MAIDISSTTRRIVYTGSMGVGPYPFNFEVLAQTDIAVYFNDTELTLTTDFTVSIDADGTGSVTIVVGTNVPTTPDADDRITIVGARTIERTTDFTTGGPLFATSLNDEFDSLTIFTQQNKEEADRSIKAPVTDPSSIDMTLPKDDDRKGKYLSFNATTGNPEVVNTVTDVTTIAGIASDVTTVSGIASDVTTVADNDANVTTVATNISSVNTVATNIADVITVANDLAEAISEVETVANDLNEATSEIDTVANSISNVDAVGTNIANVNTVAGISANVTSVAGNATNINTVAGIDSDVTTVAGISADVTTVAADGTDIGVVAGLSTEIGALSPIASDITTVSGISANVTAVAADATDIGTVATDIANVNTVATNISNVNTVAGINSDVTAVAADATDIGTVATNIANVNTTATNISNVNTVAGISSEVTTVAGDTTAINQVYTNLTDVVTFGETYLGALASAPTTTVTGALYFNTTDDQLYVWDGSVWQAAAFSASGAVTSFNTRTGAVTLSAADVNTALGSDAVLDSDIGSTVQAYDATILKSADIGTSVQGYDADTAKYDDVTANFTGTLQNGGSNVVVDTDIGSTVQAYDADTTKNDVANTFTANQTISGSLDLTASTTEARAIEIGKGRTGDGFAYIDLVGDATYTDYGTRLIRSATGANTTTDLIHRGTGDLRINAQDAAAVSLRTSNNERIRITSTGAVGIGTSSPTYKLDVSGLTRSTGYLETVYAISGTTPTLSETNGNIQTWTLAGNSTPTGGPAAGASITLMIDDGTAYTITWTSVVDQWIGGSAPTLATTGYTVVELWTVGATTYGAYVGDAS